MGRLFRWVATLAALAVIIASGAGFLSYELFRQSGPLQTVRTLVIPSGHGTGAVARLLKGAGIISHEYVLRIGARLYQPDIPLKAGEFSFAKGASARQVLNILRHGRTVVRRLTVAEGLSIHAVLARLGATEGLKGALPHGLSEGELLPETYHFSYGDARADIVQRMRAAMTGAMEKLWAGRAPDLPLNSPSEALILASIIEKETGLAEERARVAGVFINRLSAGMRLQSDPTVVYGLTHGQGKLGRRLTRADLKSQSPYNTYVHKGLPPGPIANPGIAAIAAALNPVRSVDFYFVADGSGGHVFARTLAGHNRNVRRWRKLQKTRQNKE
jgi:UPF0755 protein